MEGIRDHMGKKIILDPLFGDDCVQALIQGYTSEVGECPFFSESVESKCFLDPYSRRTWNCNGRCFVNGFRCEYISEALPHKNLGGEINFLISLIGSEGISIIRSLGWSLLTTDEVLAVSDIKKEELPFKLTVLKILKLVSEKNGTLHLTDKGRMIHDYLLLSQKI
ncbi:MAG: hypothetical protein KIH08_04840 [Candidatus Freyarchaeota archaeon]|nr:hypothetical protein [Candidatus Jordarchaeia archaeon]MBS7268922.1 hypothetical protein [Candidatus Jordarchaeia archaeon]MBS7279618.1 hypothetical protein [Candidatus Jordarchaeia archaeon]